VLPCSEKLETSRNYLRHGKTGQIKNMTSHKNPSPNHKYWSAFCLLFVYNVSDFTIILAHQPPGARASSFTMFLDHTQRRNTVGRTPLDEWSARRRDLYLATYNTHNRQISMPPVGFEPIISASAGPFTYTLDRAATIMFIVMLQFKLLISGILESDKHYGLILFFYSRVTQKKEKKKMKRNSHSGVRNLSPGTCLRILDDTSPSQ
jgi:hypothetical protein